MTASPELNLPRLGASVDARAQLAYVKRASATHQAALWNEILADDPIFGPSSGLVVGVGPRMDDRYPLVWVRRHEAGGS